MTSRNAPRGESQLWSGLPAEAKVREWENVVPGSAAILLKETRKQVRHMRRLAMAQVLVQLFPGICALASVVLFVWLARYFVNHNAPNQGAAVVGAGLVSLVATFLGRKAISERKRTASAVGPAQPALETSSTIASPTTILDTDSLYE